MHLLQPQHCILHYLKDLELTQRLPFLLILGQKVIHCLLGQLHQNIPIDIPLSLHVVRTMIPNHMGTP